MPHYVALLRAVNVGGRTVRMEPLRVALEAIGLSGVETLIASGNVLFHSRSRSDSALEKKIEGAMAKAFGFDIVTMVRSAPEIQAVAASEPFGALGEARLHIAFLKTIPPRQGVEKVMALRSEGEAVHLDGRELYFRIPGRMSDSAMFRAPIEKLLGVPMTVRTAGTVKKLADRAAE